MSKKVLGQLPHVAMGQAKILSLFMLISQATICSRLKGSLGNYVERVSYLLHLGIGLLINVASRCILGHGPHVNIHFYLMRMLNHLALGKFGVACISLDLNLLC